jgi:putative membrane protein
MDLSVLPTLNAVLNATSAVLLACGFAMIRRRRVAAHRACMIAAFATSLLFLTSYTIYHAQAGSHPFPGHGIARPIYFAILISHVTLAALILPMAILTLTRALRAQYARHMNIARWTLPLWLYVSVTGVVIYVMLYRVAW